MRLFCKYGRSLKRVKDRVLFMSAYWPVHRGVIELPQCDNATQCSSALLLPAEPSAAEQEEVELGQHRAVTLSL